MVEHALSVLGTIAELSGSFLARRLNTEAWPQLARLLREGPTLVRTPSMLPGEERLAPAVLQRARLAVLACLPHVRAPLLLHAKSIQLPWQKLCACQSCCPEKSGCASAHAWPACTRVTCLVQSMPSMVPKEERMHERAAAGRASLCAHVQAPCCP